MSAFNRKHPRRANGQFKRKKHAVKRSRARVHRKRTSRRKRR